MILAWGARGHRFDSRASPSLEVLFKETFLDSHALETLVNMANELNFMFYVLKHFLRISYVKIMLLKFHFCRTRNVKNSANSNRKGVWIRWILLIQNYM